MNLDQLEAFSVIVREKSFSKAAEMMHLTQSALSIRISKLEAEIETDLFIRDGRTIRLSKYGELYLPFVQRILALTQESKMMLHQAMNEEKLHLHIGTTSRIATYLLPSLLEQFQNVMPQVDISIQTGLSEEVLEMLHDYTIHIALINDPPEDERWDKLLLFRDRILLISSPDHPLYGNIAVINNFLLTPCMACPSSMPKIPPPTSVL
ncbi:LysR family transcriptional regulator [Cohnella kolymensis]|uniref:LysR family transcriptional regulator n=1 Tax=Cohnella kolymensis TaxID=1590652 RepID=UPI00137920EE|nr:LysR family transcriptional regulator [Cohnella kolymensis]